MSPDQRGALEGLGAKGPEFQAGVAKGPYRAVFRGGVLRLAFRGP